MYARLKQNQYVYSTEQVPISGISAGEILAKGLFPDIKISADLKAEETGFLGKALELKPSKMTLSLSGVYPVLEIKDHGVIFKNTRLDNDIQILVF